MIALLIVFQQEVRRFLLLVGSKYNLQNIFNLEKLFAKPVIKEDVSDAIVEACVNFSASKTGALIVFQQNTELYNYAQTGVMMKAKVTDELIENIFFKNTPLHDGAVIINENKILAARCILRSPGYSRKYGIAASGCFGTQWGERCLCGCRERRNRKYHFL